MATLFAAEALVAPSDHVNAHFATIDDHHTKRHYCDVLIDYNYYPPEAYGYAAASDQTSSNPVSKKTKQIVSGPYKGLLSSGCNELAGIKYVLLDDVYQQAHQQLEQKVFEKFQTDILTV